jgi:MFS family permease
MHGGDAASRMPPMHAPVATHQSGQSLALLAWLAGAAFFFYAWVLRVAPSVMVEELMREFAVGAAVLGNLSAAYFYGYAGMQIPVGVLLDRFGPRRPMTAAAVVCGMGCVLFALSGSLTTVTAGRFLIGASAAFSLVGAMAIAGQWFSAHRFALLSGFAMAMGMAGGVLGQAPLRLVVEATDWRAAMLMLAAGGFLLALATFATVRDKRRGSGGLGSMLAGLVAVLRHRQTLLVAITSLATAAPLLGLAGLWGVPFLETAYGLSRTQAASLTSLMFVGWGVGAPIMGWLSDRIGRRRTPIIVGLILQTLALAGFVYIPGLPIAVLACLSFLVGLLGSAQIVSFALVRENHPLTLSGTAIGVVNALMTGAGALFQPLIGALLDFAWSGETVLGARVYSVAAYQLAFTSLIVCCLISFACALAVRESYCRQMA